MNIGKMKVYKRLLSIIICVVMATIFVACDSNKSKDDSKDSSSTNTISTDSSAQLSNGTKKEVTVQDYKGNSISFNGTPSKVIVLSPELVGVLDELGVELLASSTLTDDVKASLKNNQNMEDVGSEAFPDMNRIKALKPDVIILGSAFSELSESIVEAGFQPWVIDNQTYSKMMQTTEQFGEVFNKQAEAKQLIDSIESRVYSIVNNIEEIKPPTFLVLYGTADGIMVAGNNSFVGNVLTELGCRNLANTSELEAEIPSFLYRMDEENISKLNPDIIIRIYDDASEKVKTYFDENDQKMKDGGSWSNMNAAKNGKVFTLQIDGFATNPGRTMIDSIEALAELAFGITIEQSSMDGVNANMRTIIDFLTQNKNVHMATVGSDGTPSIHTIQFQFYENGRIYFQTDFSSSAYQNMKSKPQIEFISNSRDETQALRVRGEVVFDYNLELLKRVMDDNPNIKKIYGSENNPTLTMFYLDHGSATIYEFSNEIQGSIFSYKW